MKMIAPSILSADFARLGDELRAVEDAGANWIHVDVMDGRFVPNITMGPIIVEAAKRCTALPLDVHLMIEKPEKFIRQFADAGSAVISVHAEACVHLNRTIGQIKESGVRAGVVLNPATPLTAIEWVLEDVDLVLLMSVNPGFGGQVFIVNTLEKVRRLRRMIDDRKLNCLIEVDGGVNTHTIAEIATAGTDVFVAGSAIFGSHSYKDTMAELRSKI
jgi:ribulose-phosphate 3-epimerase